MDIVMYKRKRRSDEVMKFLNLKSVILKVWKKNFVLSFNYVAPNE